MAVVVVVRSLSLHRTVPEVEKMIQRCYYCFSHGVYFLFLNDVILFFQMVLFCF
ncbi:hypothetical protein Hdeb2414_s0003g00101011 [Helianthus debilis subsp. tardiflorus]